jgi:multimeric flavodoxin WrbA
MALRELILHDLGENEAAQALPAATPDLAIFAALPEIKPCQGCFGCWVKTPGRCVINDRGADFAVLLAKRDRLTIVSRLVFGGLSGPVKALLDRSIGFILPFFESRGGSMFHTRRYPESPLLRYFFHGPSFGTNLATAEKLARANAQNFMSPEASVRHFSTLGDLRETLNGQG